VRVVGEQVPSSMPGVGFDRPPQFDPSLATPGANARIVQMACAGCRERVCWLSPAAVESFSRRKGA
jgi:hypothetical protein